MTGRAYTAALHWLMRNRHGRRAGDLIALTILRSIAYVERHQTDPIPPGEQVGANWVAKRKPTP